MGQYYKIVNLDKLEYLDPHRFGDGLKLLEFGSSGCGTMNALAILLADGNGRWGGDLDSEKPIVGSWAGDRIVVAGDYADKGKWEIEGPGQTLYGLVAKKGKDVSKSVIAAMMDDSYLKRSLQESGIVSPNGEKIAETFEEQWKWREEWAKRAKPETIR